MKTLLQFSLYLFQWFYAQSHSVIGKWKTIDDERQSKISCEIYERSGKIYGKIVDIVDAEKKKYVLHALRKKNKPVMGLVIIKGLKKDGKEYNDGKF
jgi:hypothetical protein